MTKHHHSFNCEDFEWEALTSEAEKEKISVNSLIQKIVAGFVNKSEVLPMVTDVDLEIKKEKLTQLQRKNEGILYENRIKKATAIYLETFGVAPSHNGRKAISEGSRYDQHDERISFLSDEKWKKVFLVCVESHELGKMSCIPCGFPTEHRDTMQAHLLSNHQSEVAFALKEILTR